MYLIDTSVWIDVLKDRSRSRAQRLRSRVGDGEIVLCRFTQLELLQGTRDQADWELLDKYLSGQEYLEMQPGSWRDAARLFFELRRAGKTVRSPIDCCIAQLAIEHEAVILHRDRDLSTLSEHAQLQQEFLKWSDESS